MAARCLSPRFLISRSLDTLGCDPTVPDEVICDGTKLVPVLERREFAVPVPSGRAGGTVADKPGRRVRDVTTLDPADPVDRQLITVNDLSARMISQHSFGNYVAVVECVA